MSGDETRAARIAKARQELAERQAADPEGVQRFAGRMARIEAARKRERERFNHLVLGKPREMETVIVGKRAGRHRPQRRLVPVRLEPEIEAAVSIREAWSHKMNGTAQTHEHAARTHADALAQLHANGSINNEQLEWTAQIANVHRSIESDVGVKVASLEARVDTTSRPAVIAERIHRVRMHRAYGFWRDMLPAPKALVLDMIVGDAIGYTVAARRHRVHNRKAKRLLLDAIDRWPLCVAHAFSIIDQPMVDAMNQALAPLGVEYGAPRVTVRTETYEQARQQEAGREQTDEPYLLPPIDPAFLNEAGYLRPWHEIAEIVRARAFGDEEIAEQPS
jgi:hypothetical protein